MVLERTNHLPGFHRLPVLISVGSGLAVFLFWGPVVRHVRARALVPSVVRPPADGPWGRSGAAGRRGR